MEQNEMKRFIEENINVIPENYVKKFEQLSIERKVSKIKHYLEMQKWREEGIERNSVLFRVKNIFEKRKANKEDAEQVIDFANKFIEGFKKKELERLDAEIAKLNAMKAAL